MKKYWKPLDDKIVFQDGVLRIRHKNYFYEKANAPMTFTVMDISDWAIIVPETEDGGFILVHQFRIGFEEDTLEFPGGGVNKNEDPLVAAGRELLEETGATAKEIILLGVIQPNPAFMTNRCHIYLAKGCNISGKQHLDKFEDAQTVIVTKNNLKEMINNGEFSQGISLAAFGLYLNSTD